ncbi:MAG: ABC transporter ATP-binding protein, partial [Proteobacteria bacterium]
MRLEYPNNVNTAMRPTAMANPAMRLRLACCTTPLRPSSQANLSTRRSPAINHGKISLTCYITLSLCPINVIFFLHRVQSRIDEMIGSEYVLSMTDVVKTYQLGETRVHALRGLNLKMRTGEFTAVVGTSGSGKSTMLNLIGGIDSADSGTVEVGGKIWTQLSDDERSKARNTMIGFIFQSFNLMPTLNVQENIELPLM